MKTISIMLQTDRLILKRFVESDTWKHVSSGLRLPESNLCLLGSLILSDSELWVAHLYQSRLLQMGPMLKRTGSM